MNGLDFFLDFPYEIEKRYQRMCQFISPPVEMGVFLLI